MSISKDPKQLPVQGKLIKAAIGNKRPYVVIVDAVADETNIDLVTASMDMQMLMGTG